MRFDHIDLEQLHWIYEHFPTKIIDVREKEEYENFHLRNAVNIPYEELYKQVLPKDKIYVVYCDHGIQSLRACRDLALLGYTVYNLIGGLKSYDKDIDS